jgi:hypothetical protein
MISLKLQQDITNIATPDNMVDDEIGEYSNVELEKFVINVKRQIMCVLNPFLSCKSLNLKCLTTCYVLC